MDRPIIFSAPMVRALLDGRKSQTRRLATSPLRRCEVGDRLWVRETVVAEELSRPPASRKATARERQHLGRTSVIVCDELDGSDGVRYLADDAWSMIENTSEAGDAWFELFHYGCKDDERPSGHRGKSVPSIHMPRWASRLTLIVEAVRVETLQDITEADCIAEGPKVRGFMELSGGFNSLNGVMVHTDQPHVWATPRCWYRELWGSLHDKPGQRWADNPDVVALTFRVERGNIDRNTP